MDVPMLMAAMARHVTASGLVTAFAEPPPTLEAADLPALVLYWDGEEDTVIAPDMDGDMWSPVIRGRLYGAPLQGETPEEFAAVNRLIPALVRTFHQAGNPNTYLSGLDGHVDRLRVQRVRASLNLGYAAGNYAGADLIFGAKFHDYEELP